MGVVSHELQSFAKYHNHASTSDYNHVSTVLNVMSLAVVFSTICFPVLFSFASTWSASEIAMLLGLILARFSQTFIAVFMGRMKDVIGMVHSRMIDEINYEILEFSVIGLLVLMYGTLWPAITGLCIVNLLFSFVMYGRSKAVLSAHVDFTKRPLSIRNALQRSRPYLMTIVTEKGFESGLPLIVQALTSNKVLGLFSIYKLVYNIFLKIATVTGDVLVPKLQTAFFTKQSNRNLRREFSWYLKYQIVLFAAGFFSILSGLFSFSLLNLIPNSTYHPTWASTVLVSGLLAGATYLCVESLKRVGKLPQVMLYHLLKLGAFGILMSLTSSPFYSLLFCEVVGGLFVLGIAKNYTQWFQLSS